MALGKSKEKVAKDLSVALGMSEEEVTTAPVYDAVHGTVEKANQENPPTKPAPKVPPTE